MDKIIASLKKQFEDQPLQTLAVSGVFIGAIAKLWEARTAAHNRRTWDREVTRRAYKDRRR